MDANTVFNNAVVVQPGSTSQNVATTDLTQTISFSDIDFDDNWAPIDYLADPDEL